MLDLSPQEQLSERVTFRLSKSDVAALDRASRAFGLEPTRIVRRLLVKALRELEPEIAKRLAVPEHDLF